MFEKISKLANLIQSKTLPTISYWTDSIGTTDSVVLERDRFLFTYQWIGNPPAIHSVNAAFTP